MRKNEFGYIHFRTTLQSDTDTNIYIRCGYGYGCKKFGLEGPQFLQKQINKTKCICVVSVAFARTSVYCSVKPVHLHPREYRTSCIIAPEGSKVQRTEASKQQPYRR